MKCKCCPALIDCSNEDVGHETACWLAAGIDTQKKESLYNESRDY